MTGRDSPRDTAFTPLIQIELPTGKTCWGASVDTNIELATIEAMLKAVNQTQR